MADEISVDVVDDENAESDVDATSTAVGPEEDTGIIGRLISWFKELFSWLSNLNFHQDKTRNVARSLPLTNT